MQTTIDAGDRTQRQITLVAVAEAVVYAEDPRVAYSRSRYVM